MEKYNVWFLVLKVIKLTETEFANNKLPNLLLAKAINIKMNLENVLTVTIVVRLVEIQHIEFIINVLLVLMDSI